MANVLVTGGAGFIGSHVARCFLERGDHVSILDDLSSGRRERVPEGARLHELDLRSQAAASLVRGGGFDVICHLAAQIDVRRSVADPIFDAMVNIVGTLNLLEAVRHGGRRTRVIFSSTGGAIYGDDAPAPTPESADKAPMSPYGTSKLAVECYLSYYARVHGMDVATLRYANVYGPGQDGAGEAGVVAKFCERILAGEPITVFGDGLQTRDYVYVGDVARANLALSTALLPTGGGLDARAFNIGTGVESSVLDLVGHLARVSGEPVEVRHAAERVGEQRRSVLSIGRTRAALGWRPVYSLRDGLEETFAWFARRHAAGSEAAVPV